MTPSGTAAGANTIHDEPHDAWRPPGGVPLHLDEDEQVTGKKQRRPRDLAAVRGPGLTKSGHIDFKACLAKAMERQPIALRLELRGTPIRHGDPPPACGKQDAGIGWRRLMGTERPRQLKGFEAFLLADYPYRLGYGGQSLSAACGSQTPAIRAPTSPLRT